MNIGVTGSGKSIYHIPYNDEKIEVEVDNEFMKALENNEASIQVITEEELDACTYYFKCPYRRYPKTNEFRYCIERQCMAFRANDKSFWCALMEPARGEESSLHPIEMLHQGDEDW